MVQNKLPLINSTHGSETRNIINELIKLFNGMGYTYNESLKMSREILENARQTNNMNQDVQKQINNLILSDGESDAEVIQARGDHEILKDRLDNIDKNLAERSVNIMNPPPPLIAAKGDGVANDYGAILGIIRLLESQGGGALLVPDGTFSVDQTFEIRGNNISFLGVGRSSHIKMENDVRVFQATGYDDLTFHRLHITGARSSAGQLGDGHGIVVCEANRPIVTECSFENLSGKGVFYAGFYGETLSQGVHDGIIEKNYMNGCSEGFMIYNDCHRVSATKNFIFNSSNVGIFVDDSHRLDDSEIARECTYINVEGNYVKDSRGTGIGLAGAQFSAVRDNFVIDGGLTSGSNVDGIVLQSIQNLIPCDHNIVEGNTVRNNSNIAIALIGASDNIIRGNNLLNNSYKRSSGGTQHINMRSHMVGTHQFTSSRNIVEGNYSVADDSNSTLSTHVMIDGTGENEDNIVRHNNFIGGSAGFHITDRGTNTHVADNMYNGKLVDTGFPDGTPSSPSISFNNDSTTGFYRNAAGELSASYKGSYVLRFRNAGLQIADGKDFLFETGTGSRFGTSPLQKMGFWGATPKQQPENIPQTSGKTLSELEQEINKLKLLLRNLGLMG